MCYGHVVDLSTGHVIQALIHSDAHSEEWTMPPLENIATAPTYNDARACDPITHAHAVVRAIRGSGMRHDAFEDIILNGNTKGWFIQGQPPKAVQLKKLQLLCGVCTRWDSEYYMLNRLRELHLVCFFDVCQCYSLLLTN